MYIKKNIETNGALNFKYNVLLTNDVFDDKNKSIKNYIDNKRVLIFISQEIERLYYKEIYSYFCLNTENESFKIIKVNTGEENKNLSTISYILKEAKNFDLARNSLMIAVGGGILMDMVGMAASMYRRGIPYIRIPTTLLGQIDAGVGIKTGVNFEDSKNFIGSFYPPIACINCPNLLKTLPLIELQNGLSEIIKMSIITDQKLFNLLEECAHEILKAQCHSETSYEISYLAIKSMIDELETNFYEENLKRLVDFGHSFSPFIETHSNYKISHGFAVALDMAISTEIAFLLKRISISQRNMILELMLKVGLNIYNAQTFKPNLMLDSLKHIVLHRAGNLNLVVPTGIGKADFIEDLEVITHELLSAVFTNLNQFQKKYSDKYFSQSSVTSPYYEEENILFLSKDLA